MRYEHIELDISTAACSALFEALTTCPKSESELVRNELGNLVSELRARLQRRDVDPHCPKNASEEWLDT